MSPNVPSEKDSMLALALASGVPLGVAAEQAGVDRKTVQRKLATPEFKLQVDEFRSEMVTTALGVMADSLTCAARQLKDLLSDENPSVRLRACRAMITLTLKLHESEDVDRQLSELKREFARLIEVSNGNQSHA